MVLIGDKTYNNRIMVSICKEEIFIRNRNEYSFVQHRKIGRPTKIACKQVKQNLAHLCLTKDMASWSRCVIIRVTCPENNLFPSSSLRFSNGEGENCHTTSIMLNSENLGLTEVIHKASIYSIRR